MEGTLMSRAFVGRRVAAPARRARPAAALAGAIAAVAHALAVSPARAEDADTQLFHAAAPTGYFRGEGPAVVGAGGVHVGAAFELGEQLLVSRDPQTGEPVMDGEIVARRAALHLTAGYGVSRNLEVGAALLAVLQSGDESAFRPALRRAAIGDLRLYAKQRLLASGRWRAAASLELALPTASTRAYLGASGAGASALLIGGLEGRADGRGWSVAAQAGYRLRSAAAIGDLEIDDELLGGVAGRYPLIADRLWAQAEIYGAWGVQGKGNELERPVEVLAGARLGVGNGWIAQAAVGLGVSQGYGTPELRGVVSLGVGPGAPPPPRLARDWTPSEDDEPVWPLAEEAEPPSPPPSSELRLVGDRIVLPAAILFELGGDEVGPEGRQVLQQVLELWRANPGWAAMSVEGHTDVRGATRQNQELSERRAQNVRAALISLGAEAGALRAIGFGEGRPLTSGQREEDHARNRRVELVITQRQEIAP